jgi:hypothetical protein
MLNFYSFAKQKVVRSSTVQMNRRVSILCKKKIRTKLSKKMWKKQFCHCFTRTGYSPVHLNWRGFVSKHKVLLVTSQFNGLCNLFIFKSKILYVIQPSGHNVLFLGSFPIEKHFVYGKFLKKIKFQVKMRYKRTSFDTLP